MRTMGIFPLPLRPRCLIGMDGQVQWGKYLRMGEAADSVLSAADSVLSAADSALSAADSVLSAADNVLSAADSVLSAADSVLSAADRGLSATAFSTISIYYVLKQTIS